MAWSIKFSHAADKFLSHLDGHLSQHIVQKLESIAALDDPRLRGRALHGAYHGLWRYRIGNYRAICDIKDQELVILAVRIGHRSRVYLDRS